MKVIIEDLTIDIHIKLNKKNFMLAQCSITIKGIGEIRGYRVMESKYGDKLNVVPPSPPNMPAYHIVRLEPSLWTEMQKALKQAYLEQLELSNASGNEEFIDPDEIPL